MFGLELAVLKAFEVYQVNLKARGTQLIENLVASVKTFPMVAEPAEASYEAPRETVTYELFCETAFIGTHVLYPAYTWKP